MQFFHVLVAMLAGLITPPAPLPAPAARPAKSGITITAMTCVTSIETLYPCTSTQNVQPNSPFIVQYTITNSSIEQDDVGLMVSGTIASCTVPTDIEVPAHGSNWFNMNCTGGSTPGSGVMTMTAEGLSELIATVNVTIGNSYGVAVTPKNQAVNAAGVTTNTQTFTVNNTGSSSTAFTLNALCSLTATSCTITSANPVTIGAFSSAPVTVTYTASTVGSIGTVRLAASNATQGVTDTGSVNETVVITVAGTPDNGAVTVPPSTGSTQIFSVTNNRPASTTYNLSAVCGPPETSCGVQSTVTVAAQSAQNVNVTYTSGALGTQGRVTLTAWQTTDGLNKDSAWVIVTSAVQGPPVVAVDSVNPGTAVDRNLCLTISTGPTAASECGDLRLSHALPTVQTLAKVRNPMLIYNSQHANPYPLVSALVTEAPGTTLPDSVTATVLVNGVNRGSGGSWKGNNWIAGATRRISVGYGALADSTGIYSYTLQITNWYGATAKPQSAVGNVIVVNRSNSRFGAGWWLAGLEQLYFPSGDTTSRLWVGGDGSARLYSKVSANVWAASAVDRPDTLKLVGSVYVQYLPHGVQVQFSATGKHVATVNRLNQTTRFVYDASGRLDTIALPPTSGGPYYRFAYNAGTGRLDSVNAPGLGATRRGVRLTLNSDGTVAKIRDPLIHSGDTTNVKFGYLAGDTNRIATRTNRRGATVTFTYDVGKRLTSASINMGAGQAAIASSIRPAESQGLRHNIDSIAAAPESVYTRLNGPRTDVTDITRYWLDRFGEPTKLVNALGYVTQLTRDDPRWPALVTQTREPNGRVVRATYDSRGNIVSSTDSSLYVDSAGTRSYATTRYQWDAKWDFATQSISPRGVVTNFAYDTLTGNRMWQQTTNNSARRATFTYYTTGVATGLLATIKTPLSPKPDSIYYDALGNVVRTVSPLGFRSRTYKDNLGRDTLLVSSRDSLQADSLWTQIRYDAWDRDTLSTSHGSSTAVLSATLPAQTDTIRKFYNVESSMDSISRWSSPEPVAPDTGKIGKLITRWKYDLAERKVTEMPPTAPGPSHFDSLIYDPAGNQVAWITRRGFRISQTFDAINRLTRRITPTTTATSIDSLTPATDSHGHPIWWVFPLYANHQLFSIPADTSVFAYDTAGNMITANDGDARISRTYLQSGLLVTDTLRIRTWATLAAGGNFTTHVYGIRYGYDLDRRRVWMKHPSNIAIQKYLSSILYDSVGYSYEDSTGRLSRIRDVMGNVFAFHYDLEGRQDSLTGPGGYGSKITFDGDGRLAQRAELLPGFGGTHGDTLHFERVNYDAGGRVLRMVTPGDSARMIYAGLGALAQSQTWSSTPVLATTFEQFMTDALGHVRWNIPSSDQFGSIHHVSHYNPGTEQQNTRRNYGGSGSDFFYDEDWYDFDGNRHYHGNFNTNQTLLEDGFSYYRADNQLRVLDKRVCYLNGYCYAPLYTPSNVAGAFEEYRYDAIGRRVLLRSRRDSTCAGGPNDRKWDCQSVIQRMVWDGDDLLFEIRMPGADTTIAASMEQDTVSLNIALAPYGRIAYTHGLAEDKPLDLIRMGYGVGTLIGPVPDSLRLITLIPHFSWRGTAEFATNPAGKTDASICAVSNVTQVCVSIFWPGVDLTAFGDAPAPATYNWFGSLIIDQRDGSGLQYMRNRYYDPAQGRFTQEDPIGLGGGLNAYGFANGNPVSFSDPFGLCPKSAGGDGATELFTDCEPGTSGWYANRIRLNEGNQFLNELGGTLATCDESYACQAALFVASLGGSLAEQAAVDGVQAARTAGQAIPRVIGPFPEYLQVAEKMGWEAFNIPKWIWKALPAKVFWALNRQFLDKGAAEGAEFVLADLMENAVGHAGYERELEYLTRVWHYVLSPDGLSLIPGP